MAAFALSHYPRVLLVDNTVNRYRSNPKKQSSQHSLSILDLFGRWFETRVRFASWQLMKCSVGFAGLLN